MNRLAQLHLTVRSQILEQISKSLTQGGNIAAATQYTKSDGTNYGMYQKADPALSDLWETVINQQRTVNVVQPQAIKGAGG